MTVCLAALCVDDGGNPLVVVAADRMVTYQGFIEFEHAVPKITAASPHALIMMSGEALTGARLARETAGALFGTSPRIADIADNLAQGYSAARRQRVESNILSVRGLNLQSFYQMHAALNGQITALIDQQMTQFDMGLELLVAGVDPSGAHIHSVHNPGVTNLQHDVIGFAAVGTGWIHTMQSMIGFHHTPQAELKETVFRAYASKRRSEVAPGVGHDTDMAIVSAAGFQQITAGQLGELARLYDRLQTQTNRMLDRHLGSLQLEVQEPPAAADDNAAGAEEGAAPAENG